jgi:hypothetical protein
MFCAFQKMITDESQQEALGNNNKFKRGSSLYKLKLAHILKNRY